MKKTKGYTLGELLITLTLIGTIAALSIPSLTKNMQDRQNRALFKKAYNEVYAAMEYARLKGWRIDKNKRLESVFQALINNLDIDSLVDENVSKRDNGAYANAGDYIPFNPTETRDQYSDDTITIQNPDGSIKNEYPATSWLVTNNNMAYIVVRGNNNKETIEEINNQSNQADCWGKAHAVIVVDINGLSIGPNEIEPQSKKTIKKNEPLDKITGDRFYIYVGKDGITAGSAQTSVGGRILSGMK